MASNKPFTNLLDPTYGMDEEVRAGVYANNYDDFSSMPPLTTTTITADIDTDVATVTAAAACYTDNNNSSFASNGNDSYCYSSKNNNNNNNSSSINNKYELQLFPPIPHAPQRMKVRDQGQGQGQDKDDEIEVGLKYTQGHSSRFGTNDNYVDTATNSFSNNDHTNDSRDKRLIPDGITHVNANTSASASANTDITNNNNDDDGTPPNKKRKQYTIRTNVSNPEKSFTPIDISRRIYTLKTQLAKRSTDHAVLCPQLQEAYSELHRHSQDLDVIQVHITDLEAELESIQNALRQERDKCKMKEELIQNAEDKVSNLEMKIPCTWNMHYEKLKTYKERHGNIDLPSRCREDESLDKLCQWVQRQKGQFRAYCEGSRKTQRPYRVIALEKLGINWNIKGDKWNIQYQKLVTFKKENNGSTIVPTKNHPDKNFANWIGVQRHEYKRMKEGKTSTLTQERLEMLNKIGFVFNVFDHKWDEMYNTLSGFKNMYGHAIVPDQHCAENPSLVKWIERQRMEYQLFMNGEQNSKRCRLTDERIKQLEDIGFAF